MFRTNEQLASASPRQRQLHASTQTAGAVQEPEAAISALKHCALLVSAFASASSQPAANLSWHHVQDGCLMDRNLCSAKDCCLGADPLEVNLLCSLAPIFCRVYMPVCSFAEPPQVWGHQGLHLS